MATIAKSAATSANAPAAQPSGLYGAACRWSTRSATWPARSTANSAKPSDRGDEGFLSRSRSTPVRISPPVAAARSRRRASSRGCRRRAARQTAAQTTAAATAAEPARTAIRPAGGNSQTRSSQAPPMANRSATVAAHTAPARRLMSTTRRPIRNNWPCKEAVVMSHLRPTHTGTIEYEQCNRPPSLGIAKGDQRAGLTAKVVTNLEFGGFSVSPPAQQLL